MKNYVVQKGDTLNDIASRFGYKNYKDAGITSVPSGNFDLIRPGETITLGGSNNNVPGYQDTTPVVSSVDSSSQFKTDSEELDSVMNPATDTNGEETDEDAGAGNENDNNNNPNLTNDGVTTDDNGNIVTGDPIFDRLQADAFAESADAKAQAEEVKEEYESLFSQELDAINERARTARREIRATFGQRIKEQQRINKVNTDRVRAYGLSSGQAMLTPIMWSDAVTEREREGASIIKDLRNQRQIAIDQANNARNQGRADLLTASLENIRNVEKRLNEKLDKIQAESEAQYELLVNMRKEQETEFRNKQIESLQKIQAFFSLNDEEYKNASPEEKTKLIEEIANKYGLKYHEVFSAIEEATQVDFDAEASRLENEKLKSEIEATDALGRQRDASASNSWASEAKTRKETELLGEDDVQGNDYTDQEKRKLREAGLADATTEQKDKYLYGDDFERIEAEESASSGGESVQSRAEQAGYDYNAMRDAGYSDEDIKKALDDAGV